MSNQIRVLKETEIIGRQFKVYGTFDEPLFLAKDVAEMIEHTNPSAMMKSVDDDEKGIRITYTPGGPQEMLFLTEAGLYEVLMQSRKPIAKEFKRGVKKVLHEIRTTGSYSNYSNDIPHTYSAALYLAAKQQEQIEEQQRQLETKDSEILQLTHEVANMEKKVSYLDTILACKSTTKVKTIAQDYGMSAIAFNGLLHELGVQYRVGDTWVLYVKYIKEGYVKDVPFEYTRKDGTSGVASNMQWTQKGRMFLYHFLKEKGILPLIEQE